MNRIYLTICACFVAMGATAQQVTKLQQGVKLDNGKVHARVQFFTDDIARVEKSLSGEYKEPQSLVVTLSPQTVKTSVSECAERQRGFEDRENSGEQDHGQRGVFRHERQQSAEGEIV